MTKQRRSFSTEFKRKATGRAANDLPHAKQDERRCTDRVVVLLLATWFWGNSHDYSSQSQLSFGSIAG